MEIFMKSKFFAQIILASLFVVVNPLGYANQAPTNAAMQQLQVDINSADAAAIAEALDGVGMAKAREIVAHRQLYGEFQFIEQLSDVTGIGEATVEKNRHRISIGKD